MSIPEPIAFYSDLHRQASAMFEASPPKPKARQFAGLRVMVENPKGTIRNGVDRDGTPWEQIMQNDYGYLSKATGADGEGLDVFLGDNEDAPNAYIVHQNHPHNGQFDEDKTVLGCSSCDEAKWLYLSNYNSPKFFRSITEMPMEKFRAMLTSAEPGGAHWKRKHGREHKVEAIFSTTSTVVTKKTFQNQKQAQEFLNKTHKGHGRIESVDGKVLRQCRCGDGETVIALENK